MLREHILLHVQLWKCMEPKYKEKRIVKWNQCLIKVNMEDWDVDNIDIWFLNIIPDMLQSLMDKKMGVPKEIYDNYENIENGI